MATLSISELRKRPGRIETFISKICEKSAFEIEGQGQVVLTGIAYEKNKKITEIFPAKGKSEIDKANKLLKKDADSKTKVYGISKRQLISITKIVKTSDFGGAGGGTQAKGNRGDMAEAIFGLAITARFMNKNEPIDENQILSLLKKVNSSSQTQELKFTSPNKNKKINDTVIFRLGLALSNLKALKNPQIVSSMGDIIKSSVQYANSKVVTSWSKLLYENNKFNEIQVVSDGIGDQTGTKVDVRVIVDEKHTDINVSLKADDVKQFGQVGGATFEAQKELWQKLLKIDVSSFESKYYEKLKKKDTIGSLTAVYSGAAQIFNKQLKSNKKTAYKNLSEGIKYFATLNEENVTLVQLKGEEAVIYEFDNLEKILRDVDVTATVITTKSYPEIQIQDDNQETLVTIRMKVENKPNGGIYVRNYIEKGKLLGKLISHLAQK